MTTKYKKSSYICAFFPDSFQLKGHFLVLVIESSQDFFISLIKDIELFLEIYASGRLLKESLLTKKKANRYHFEDL